MQFVSHIKNTDQLKLAIDSGIKEVLLGHEDLCALGQLKTSELIQLSKVARMNGVTTVLVWDILMTDPELESALKVFKTINLENISSIRVFDPGALEEVLSSTDLPVQLMLKTGSHNLKSILHWISVSSRIQKVILSSEIPKKRIQEYLKKISVAVEVLGLGPILLFYSPRHLLSHLDQSNENAQNGNVLSALADCEENSHKGFRVIETRHGTQVFHSKDYSLVEVIDELNELGISSFQIDMRLEKKPQSFVHAMKVPSLAPYDFEHWNAAYPNAVTRCFYQSNATDVLFKKLKNTKIQRNDHAFLGEVVETVKDKHIIVYISAKGEKISQNDSIKMVNPLGKEISFQVHRLMNLEGEKVGNIAYGDYAVLPYIKSAIPASVIYFNSQSSPAGGLK